MKLHAVGTKQQGIKQQGGTLIGIIIGLVIGLAIALAVSLYMKRGDMPFVKKEPPAPVAKADNGKDAAGKPALPDPNESLYAKPATSNKPALADVVPGKSGVPAGTNPKNPPLIDKTTGDPLGKLAQQQVAKADGTAPANPALPPVSAGTAPAAGSGIVNPNDDGSRYLIQAGAYKQPEEAEAMRAKLAMLGFQAQLSQRETDAGVLHRVRIGPVPDLDRTNKIRAQLAQNGIESSIIKIK
jgi:cell division protein FtsN